METTDMTSRIRVAVVGAGPAGQTHAFAFRNVSMAQDLRGLRVEPVVVVDPNAALAETVAAQYGFEGFSTDLSAILDDPSIDVVSVAVPNHLSAAIIERLVRAGKHVLSEKPLGKSAEEAEQLAQLARKFDVITGVGFSYRRIPAVAMAHELVRSGRIGRPYFARVKFFADYALDPESPMTWRFQREFSGGGALMDIGTHAIDAAEYLLGPVSQVTSALLTTEIPERPLGDSSPQATGAVDTDDTASFSLHHAGGANSSIIVSRVAAGMPCEFGFEVFGSEGHLAFEFSRIGELSVYQKDAESPGLDGPRRVIVGPDFPGYRDVMPMAARGSTAGYGEAFVAQAQNFIRCVVNGTPMDCDFEAAAQTMRVAQAVLEADAHGAAVTAPTES